MSNAIAAIVLGGVQRGVGGRKQTSCFRIAVRRRGATDTGRETHGRGAQPQLLCFDGSANPLGHFVRMQGTRLRQQHSEFFTAESAAQVDGAHLRHHRPGDCLQHLVATRLAMRIVDPLEVVEVQIEHRHDLPMAPNILELTVELVDEGASVGNARQRVDGRLLVQLPLQSLQIRNVADADQLLSSPSR